MCRSTSEKNGYAGKAQAVTDKASSNGQLFIIRYQILASCPIRGEALNPALFLPLFSTCNMKTSVPTAGASINCAGFGQCPYTPVTRVGELRRYITYLQASCDFGCTQTLEGHRLVFQTWVAGKGPTQQA